MSGVQINGLSKRFGAGLAVDDVCLSIDEGELFGLIGPDGGGKTTLFRMLVTLLRPSSGEATVDGLDIVRDYRELRARLGYMPGRFSLYKDLTVEENLRFFASVFNTTVEAQYDNIKDVYGQIEPFRRRRAGALSGGMKQKLALSCALIHRPRVLFLDEPTTGVDAVSRREFWEMLHRLRAGGLTIVVSTPYMDEAVRCDRVALMQHGRILGVDTPSNVVRSFPRPLFAVSGARRFEIIRHLRGSEHTRSVFAFGESIHYTDLRSSADAPMIEAELKAAGFGGVAVAAIPAGIEDVFMERMESVHVRS